MEEVFIRNSGLQLDNADDSPFQQQLKNALQANALLEIRNWVTKHNIDLPTCSVSSWQNWAMHAEKLVSGKNKQPPTDTFYAEEEIFYAGPVSRERGRIRGIFRGRGGLRERGWRQVRGRDDRRDYVCWVCGQHGHWAKLSNWTTQSTMTGYGRTECC
ncbi:hypothetical protein AMECASPLE_016142 [Ameca splendens]|uniref:Uncharacterized protein n=1 Tax=Ameca splendens TaxID=208324 RepID=A0ABV1AA51_9TELE